MHSIILLKWLSNSECFFSRVSLKLSFSMKDRSGGPHSTIVSVLVPYVRTPF